MTLSSTSLKSLDQNGFAILHTLFTLEETAQMIETIQRIDQNKPTFRKTQDLFAIRQFLKEVPEVTNLLFNQKFKQLIGQCLGEKAFLVKSIYFDKPEQSNWFVAYHQDLTISVDQKVALDGFGPWTVKYEQFAVQPPLELLQSIYTFRIHLDDTDEQNGALKVIPGSHAKGIYRPETIDWTKEKEVFCPVPKGGVMIMRPLLLHASNKTTNDQKRRVIHLEFSTMELPPSLQWAERMSLSFNAQS